MLNAVQVDAKVLGIQSDEALSMLWFELDWFGHDENFSLLEDKIAGVLYDVFQAVRDWRAMQDKLREVVTTWRDNKPKSGMSAENLAESLALSIGLSNILLLLAQGHTPLSKMVSANFTSGRTQG